MATKTIKNPSDIVDDNCDVLVTSSEFIAGKSSRFNKFLV